MAKYFRVPFANAGTIATVPDTLQGDGSVSYTAGYGTNYTLDPATNPTALNIEENKFNGLMNDITVAIKQYQETGTPDFITSSDNGGSPFSYAAGARARYSGINYTSLVGSNTDTPPSAKWLADNTAFRMRLTQNTTYYVAPGGNDSNAGTSGSPWLTMQHAVDYIVQNIDLAGYGITIQVANGTYTAGVSVNAPFVGGNNVTLAGNTTTPASCIISVTNGGCVLVSSGGSLNIKGFQLRTSGSGISQITATSGGIIQVVDKMDFNICASGWSHIEADDGGRIVVNADYTISSGARSHYSVTRGGGIFSNFNRTVTLTGTPAFVGGFGIADGVAMLTVSLIAFTGSATGPRYAVSLNAVINTSGSGASYFPGDAVGSSASGGQYV